jgi:acyl-CoA thioesterase I
MHIIRNIFIGSLCLALTACGGGGGSNFAAATKPQVIVAFGDSLLAEGVFVTPGNIWVTRLQEQIAKDGINSKQPVTVINAGLPGETTSEALQRLPGILEAYHPTHIFLEHGTNDIWQCPSCINTTQRNLQIMAEQSIAAGAKVIMTDITFRLDGEPIAANYTSMFTTIAALTGSAYVNLVSGVEQGDVNYHPDGVHLKDAAQVAMKDNATQVLYSLIE